MTAFADSARIQAYFCAIVTAFTDTTMCFSFLVQRRNIIDIQVPVLQQLIKCNVDRLSMVIREKNCVLTNASVDVINLGSPTFGTTPYHTRYAPFGASLTYCI